MPSAKVGTLKISIDSTEFDLSTEVPITNDPTQMQTFISDFLKLSQSGISLVQAGGELDTDPSKSVSK